MNKVDSHWRTDDSEQQPTSVMYVYINWGMASNGSMGVMETHRNTDCSLITLINTGYCYPLNFGLPGIKSIKVLIRLAPLRELFIISFHLSCLSRIAATSLSGIEMKWLEWWSASLVEQQRCIQQRCMISKWQCICGSTCRSSKVQIGSHGEHERDRALYLPVS